MSEYPNDPLSSEPPFVVCLHCGRQWDAGTGVCPHCGSIVLTGSQWPPPPEGNTPNAGRWLDKVRHNNDGSGTQGCYLGCLVYWVTTFVFGGLALWLATLHQTLKDANAEYVLLIIAFFIVLGGIYVFLRKKHPGMARGYGYAVLLAFAVSLGMTAICAKP